MLSRIYYWFLHRFVPAHQYNRIRIKSLTPGYYDPDVRMLHACFDLFEEWFHYNVFEAKLMDRETMEEDNPGMFDEMMELYKWWTIIRDDEQDGVGYAVEDHINLDKKDDIMLARLMKFRRSIWYL